MIWSKLHSLPDCAREVFIRKRVDVSYSFFRLQPVTNGTYKYGIVCVGPLHTLRALYVDTSSAKYPGSTDMDRMLDPLCKAIEALTVEQCIEVLKVRVLIIHKLLTWNH